MNIAELFFAQARKQPAVRALVLSKRMRGGRYTYRTLSFEQVAARAHFFAGQFAAHGVRPGDHVLMFLSPGEHFPAVTLALFWLGAVPVFIDPGMGKQGLLNCARHAGAKFVIGSPLAMMFCTYQADEFYGIQKFFSIGSAPMAIDLTARHAQWQLPPCVQASADERAAILFTSGATGPAKGVEYTHSIFIHQTKMLQQMFALGPGDIDFPGFPLFSLFTLSMGMTSCPPDLNPAAPGRCRPERLVRQILDTKATYLAGSPAIWKRVAHYCLEKDIQLPSVKHLVMFGAPVPASLHQQYKKILPNGQTFTPYGATEALPISCLSGDDILTPRLEKNGHYGSFAQLTEQGHGTCIGSIVEGVEVRIVSAHDGVMTAPVHELPPHQIGEILVTGPVVTKSYFQLPSATERAKVIDADGRLWHRMGDVGYKDDNGRLWFCGRQTHRAQGHGEVLYSDPIEGIFNAHPEVQTSALVAMPATGAGALVFIPHHYPRTQQQLQLLGEKLRNFAQESHLGRQVHDLYVVRHMPVDNRHNIKIDRSLLTRMIARGELQRISP